MPRPLRPYGYLLGIACFCIYGASPVAMRASTFTTAASIRQLDTSESAKGYPVVLEGVVTHTHERLSDGFFIQDATEGIYVRLGRLRPEVRSGERVRIEGFTAAGDYAPVVQLSSLTSLGPGEPPPARRVTASELATGRHDATRVEVRGVVRSAVPIERNGVPHLGMQLSSDGVELLVGINQHTPETLALADAEVILRGVAGGLFSRQRQLLAPVLLLESDDQIEIVRPPRPLASLPVQTIESLFRHAPGGSTGHRVRIRGQLLGGAQGDWIAVRDAGGGVFVESDAIFPAIAGDEVEVVGFPTRREQALWLVGASVERLRPGVTPVARSGTVKDAVDHPCQLFRLEAIQRGPPRPGERRWVLDLEIDGAMFEAWVGPASGMHPPEWREGARLTVTGISEAYTRANHRLDLHPFPTDLRLHVGGTSGVTVLASAPWHTSPGFTRAVLAILGGVLVIMLLALTIALLLARKNTALREARTHLQEAREELATRFNIRTGEWQEQVAARHAAEADFALLTAERTRLAREIHDTLEQTLASVALQLDAAMGFHEEQPEESRRLLGIATAHLREGQAEVRRSVWNLRAIKLEKATLPEALEQLGEALTHAGGPTIEVLSSGTSRPLPPLVASHLFRIAQEGLTNALKHAAARRILLSLNFDPGVTLIVSDDGSGFDVNRATAEGRFGLRGLRERANTLRANLQITSTPGQGTHLRVDVPATQLAEP